MGVKNLWDILESCKKTLPLHHLQNKRVCIDLSCWMVQLQNVNKSHCPMRNKLYLKGLFHRLRALIALNCTLIFVSDGSIPAIKLSTYRRRLKLGSEVNQDESNSCKVSSLRRNMGSEFSCMIKEAKLLGEALGIPCLDGIEEAEAQCALLNSESLCDGCFTSDSDVFLFGARTVYRDISLGEGGYVVCYEMTDIETKLGFGRHSLISLAVLLGCDYSHGVYGLGPESACQIVKSIGDSAVLQHIASEGLSLARKNMKKGKRISHDDKENYPNNKNGNKLHLRSDDKIMDVINAYLKPKCHLADSDVVRRVLPLYPFQHNKLQQLCVQFLEWPPEKTDEYILPKVAERDLRRFANLRSVSTELGVRLPLVKMPVECPVREIIKRRKAQGKECFEVSWEKMNSIKTSVVPADLIESACPEKLEEFEQRRAQGRKKNHRRAGSHKSYNKAFVNEIDQKLQDLQLDIEDAGTVTGIASSTGTIYQTSPIINVEVVEEDMLLGACSESRVEIDFQCDNTATATSADDKEVIDLVSPSPAIHARHAPKFEAKAQSIDVVDLSESETDSSPEHARKARELRLFLNSIKEDTS